MRKRRRFGLIPAMFMAVLSGAALSPARAAAPNVILIVTDDQGYGDIAAHGNPMIQTPNMDRLHAESVRLTNFHVDPTCAPTRSALMTGKYSSRTGVWHTIMGRSIMNRQETTMADVFAGNGYRTGMFGKWHLGDNYPYHPWNRGFQEVVALGGGGVQQTPDYWGNDYFDDTYWHNGKPTKYDGYCTDVFFREALRFIEASRDGPFFVYLATNAPHGPYYVADRYSKPYRDKGVPGQMANFYGMITNIDENLGKLRERLKEWGLEENTILIFMTDNGTAAGILQDRQGFESTEKGWRGFNAGMRGHKGAEYEGGHRVPFFIRWPAGAIAGGLDNGTLSAHIDVLPTLMELCGLKNSPKLDLDGSSLAATLKGGTQELERTLTVHSQRIEYPEKWRKSAVMTSRWRLVDGKELYDIRADPGQRDDVAAKYRNIVSELRSAYEVWWKRISERFDEYSYILVGADQENPTRITAHDWHAVDDQAVPWNQPLIKNGPFVNGYWMIEVERPGTYELTLYQQDIPAHFPIEASNARIKIGDVEASKPVAKGAESVTFDLDLKAGPAKLQTWFADTRGRERGAFFVYAKRK